MPAHTIRVLAESKNNKTDIRDTYKNQKLFWWRGNSLRIETALTHRDNYLSASEIGTLTAVVKAVDSGPEDPAVMIRELTGADCDASFDSSAWKDGTGQLVAFEWAKEEAAIADGEYVLIISHDDTEGDRHTFLHASVTVEEDQHESTALSNPADPVSAEYETLQAIGEAYQNAVNEGYTGSQSEWLVTLNVAGESEFQNVVRAEFTAAPAENAGSNGTPVTTDYIFDVSGVKRAPFGHLFTLEIVHFAGTTITNTTQSYYKYIYSHRTTNTTDEESLSLVSESKQSTSGVWFSIAVSYLSETQVTVSVTSSKWMSSSSTFKLTAS